MTSTKTPTGDLVTRALAAWYRAGNMDQPSNLSDVYVYDDKEYVLLVNVNGLLGVYRVTPGGQLKRLKRWPAALTEAVEG